MSTGLIFHNDLDGLYSALAIIKSNQFEIDKVFPVDYGKSHNGIKDQCDEFIIVDYADNITEEKTSLWIDHHINGKEDLPENSIVKESPSCLRLLANAGISSSKLDPEIIKAIDIVDSANYPFDKGYSQIDVLFPSVDNTIGQATMLNQLLMKNRKTNISIELLIEDTFDLSTLLYRFNNSKSAKIKVEDYYNAKQKFTDKLLSDDNGEYIQYFENIPILITKEFSKKDWKGYDRNVFYFAVREHPYTITTFDFGYSFNFQISKNIFYDNKKTKDLDLIFENEEDLRGHKNILNFTYENKL